MNKNKAFVIERCKEKIEYWKDYEAEYSWLITHYQKEKTINTGSVYQSFADNAELKAYLAWLEDGDIPAFKQHCYVASLLMAKSCDIRKGGWDMFNLHPFIFPLLSDSSEMINLYATLRTTNYDGYDWNSVIPFHDIENHPESTRYEIVVLQSVLKHDWSKYEALKTNYFERIKKPNQFNQWLYTAYDSIRDRDSETLKFIILRFLHPKVHRYLNKDISEGFAGQIWSNDPIRLTKLAWMNGMEIHIDNPLVPMELMPVEPLAHYDYHYEFLAPDWTPPQKPKSFWQKLFAKK